jgi:hypothetical protein
VTTELPVDPTLVDAAAGLSEETAGARHAELAEAIVRANRLYYEEDAPELSDAEYDALFRELVALETAWPALVTPDSPTQRVGGTPTGQFAEVRHERPMLSLANAFSHDELRAFDARVRRGLGLPAGPEPAEGLTYVAELKIDGLAIALRYERGRFVQGATRGECSSTRWRLWRSCRRARLSKACWHYPAHAQRWQATTQVVAGRDGSGAVKRLLALSVGAMLMMAAMSAR